MKKGRTENSPTENTPLIIGFLNHKYSIKELLCCACFLAVLYFLVFVAGYCS